MGPFEARITEAADLLARSTNAVAFTGAGISTESGIADFRSPGGVWDRHRIVTYQEFLADGAARREYWTMKRELFREMGSAKPNSAHRALADLEEAGRLSCVITQNIDGLHQEAGSKRVIELHGTNRKALCLGCAQTWPIEEIMARLEAGEAEPRCEDCQGIIKPATVSFGQPMPEAELREAFALAGACDLMLMIGSSLQVEPAASIPRAAAQAAASLIFINRTETPWDMIASVRFPENAGEVLSALVRLLRPA